MKNTSNPRISVCIPIYNCEDYIGQAIESVLGQTLSTWELIILDNNSSDRSLEIIKQYTDPRIHLIENGRNMGFEANWNLALSAAKGEYIKLLPADDYLLPECLERQSSVFQQPGCQSVVLTSCARHIVDQSGKKLVTRRFPGRGKMIDGHAAIRKVVRSGTNLLGEPGAILFKRETLRQAGRFDGSLLYVIDVDLWLRLLLEGDLYVLRDPLCAFRLSSGSYSIEISALQSHHFSSFIRKLVHNPKYHIGWTDMWIGMSMSQLLAWGRRLFYYATVKKKKAGITF